MHGLTEQIARIDTTNDKKTWLNTPRNDQMSESMV